MILVCCCWGNRFTEVGDFLQIPLQVRAGPENLQRDLKRWLFCFLTCWPVNTLFSLPRSRKSGQPSLAGHREMALWKTDGRGPCGCQVAGRSELTVPAWPHCPMHRTCCLQDRGGVHLRPAWFCWGVSGTPSDPW